MQYFAVHELRIRYAMNFFVMYPSNIGYCFLFTQDFTLPTVQLPVREGRNELWGKTREAFRYVWNHYRDQADWFLKADDDTYAKKYRLSIAGSNNALNHRFIIVENLRYFLSAYNTSDALWFGHKFKAIVKKGYFSGGAG